jgi:hypothetical protein
MNITIMVTNEIVKEKNPAAAAAHHSSREAPA